MIKCNEQKETVVRNRAAVFFVPNHDTNVNLTEHYGRFQWTQQDLASKVRVTRQTIAALEKRDYTPSLLLAMTICLEFQMTVEEVFQLKGEDPQ